MLRSPAPLTTPLLHHQVLKVHLLGHRKRIIASLAERPYEEPPQKPPRFSQLRVSSKRETVSVSVFVLVST